MLFSIYEIGRLGNPEIINKSLTGFIQVYLVRENIKLVFSFLEYR